MPTSCRVLRFDDIDRARDISCILVSLGAVDMKKMESPYSTRAIMMGS